MQIAQILAGYSLADADSLRRAMGKKKKEVMQEERGKFLAGARQHSIPEKTASQIFDAMETFAAYGFNKSHAAAYAFLSYQTAYLKTHFPHEFMAALMSIEMGDTSKTYKNIADCRLQNIPVLPPDVNVSDEGFTVGEDSIRFGLGAVKGVGSKAIEVICQARQDGPFEDWYDFNRRVQGPQVNKRVMESLIKCGALDSFGLPRAQLLAGCEAIMKWAEYEARRANSAQMGLFAASGGKDPTRPELPQAAEWSEGEQLNHEREILGFFITGHPLDRYESRLHGVVSLTTALIKGRAHQEKVRLAGMVQTLKLKNNKKGDRYATFTLEDKAGVVEVIVWPEAYRKYEQSLHADEPICLSGALDVDEDRCQIIADELVPLESVAKDEVSQVHIQVPSEVTTREDLLALRDALTQHQGGCPAFLHLLWPDHRETIIALPQTLCVAPTRAMLSAVEDVFGSGVASFR